MPPDVAHALGRVESESARMTTLVDDLLLLARLDSGRPLDREPVDLSGLVVDTVNDAHAAGRDHRWLLDLPDEPVTVPGDAARLHQVLANLLANARTHTPPGTTVVTTLATTADGCARGDASPTTARASRSTCSRTSSSGSPAATRSRSRAAGSTGLGLAIVAAVVEAHGGQVSVPQPTRADHVHRRPERRGAGRAPIRSPVPRKASGPQPTHSRHHGSGPDRSAIVQPSL